MSTSQADIIYLISPSVTNDVLNALFDASWPEHEPSDFQKVLSRSLVYVCAYHGERLIGYVNVAWDGGIHGFLLDTTVHPEFRRRGIGQRLVQEAIQAAREKGLDWLHVDFEPHLLDFYRGCGFRHTEAGLVRLQP